MAGDLQLNLNVEAATVAGCDPVSVARVRYQPAESVAKLHPYQALLSLSALDGAAYIENVADLGEPKSSAWILDRQIIRMELVRGGTFARVVRRKIASGAVDPDVVAFYTLTAERPVAYYFQAQTTAAVASGSTPTSMTLTLDLGDDVIVSGFVTFAT